ncbi:MAG TPA: hypothetical protein VIM67_11480 [Terriglobus sp.]
MRRFLLIQAWGMWLLVTASMQAQQSIGDAMRHAAVVSSPMPAEGLLAPPDSVEAALHSLYQRAEVVFTGEVTLVERKGDAVAVSFRVEDGIRNVVSGSTYVLREWSGLWADDASRYVVGERRLMLLHANSVCGFASPAGGSSGAIRLHGDAVQGTADLRWVAAQVAVKSATSTTPVASAFAQAVPITQGSDESPIAVDHSALDSAVVTGMLHAWQRSETVR